MSSRTLDSPGDHPEQLTKDSLEGHTASADGLTAELRLAKLKLKGIEEISRALGSEHNMDHILDVVMERTTILLQAERSTLFIVDEAENILWSRNTQGGAVETMEVPLGHGIAGWVAMHRRTINIKNAYKDPRFDPSVDERTGYRTKGVLCAPLLDSQQKILGVIQVLNKHDGYFTPADEDLLVAIASQAAISIHNSKLYLDIVGKNIDLMDTSMRLEARRAELELLFKIERSAALATSIDSALEGLLDATLEEFPSEGGAIFLETKTHTGIRCATARGPMADLLLSPDLDLVPYIWGELQQNDAALRYLRHSQSAPTEGPLTQNQTWLINHLLALPVKHQTAFIGCLVLVNRQDNPRGFSEQDERILALIASRIGLSVALARAMEEEQKAARLASIGTMLSGVIHDLKTPLTVIGGYARLMAGENETDERQTHREKIQRQIGEIKEMTRELLSFASGQSQTLFRKVMIRSFLEESAELLREEFSGTGIELVIDDQFGGAVRLDTQKMRRLIYNLARNALEALTEGGTFRVQLKEEPNYIVFRFSDDGPGIPEEISNRLFESFTTFGKSNGTGLGLAIVKKIAEEHKGTVTVSSEPDKGTVFTVRISKHL